MGTRINVYLSHDLPRVDDTAATIDRLNAALPGALALRAYWQSVNPDSRVLDDDDRWVADLVNPRLLTRRRYTGPGSLFLDVSPATVLISTGGRWRGFLSIEPLRRAHWAAFRAVAAAFGSRRLAIGADYEDVWEVFIAGGSQEECIAQLHAKLGPPQPSVESIAPEIAAQAEHRVPMVWFLEANRR